jgi:hypothetical protein
LGTLAHAHRFAVCPFAPRVSGATNFFLASALSWSPTGLATSRWRRRAMRPTDFCHPNELRAPAPRAFPARSRSFRCGDAPRRLRLRAVNRGTGHFHDVRGPLRRTVVQHESRALLPHGLETRAWAFSSHGADGDRASDTPVANPVFTLTPRSLSRALLAWPYVRLLNGLVGRRMRRPPRPPLTPARESRRLVMIRDAFYQ